MSVSSFVGASVGGCGPIRTQYRWYIPCMPRFDVGGHGPCFLVIAAWGTRRPVTTNAQEGSMGQPLVVCRIGVSHGSARRLAGCAPLVRAVQLMASITIGGSYGL